MIPEHNQSGVLPPFIGSKPTVEGAMAPYKASLLQVAQKFAINEDRIQILKGLISYRKELRKEGITFGFQWIDGSFVEKSEHILGRPPKDIDLITFSPRPEKYNDPDIWRKFFQSRLDLFDPEQSKNRYFCDAYFVDLRAHPIYLVNQTKYWFGLFSHQRATFLWKGILELSLDEDDIEASAFLDTGGAYGK